MVFVFSFLLNRHQLSEFWHHTESQGTSLLSTTLAQETVPGIFFLSEVASTTEDYANQWKMLTQHDLFLVLVLAFG